MYIYLSHKKGISNHQLAKDISVTQKTAWFMLQRVRQISKDYDNQKQKPYLNILKIKTVSLTKNRACGKEWIFDKKADFYLSTSYFGNNKVVKSFNEVKYKNGIAIIYTTDK